MAKNPEDSASFADAEARTSATDSVLLCPIPLLAPRVFGMELVEGNEDSCVPRQRATSGVRDVGAALTLRHRLQAGRGGQSSHGHSCAGGTKILFAVAWASLAQAQWPEWASRALVGFWEAACAPS